MRQTISGFVAAIAVVAAGTLPASACGVFESTCGYVVAAPVYTGCDIGCGWAYERLPNPELQYHAAVPVVHQYYYADQGPTYTGPGDLAPYRLYQETAIGGWGVYRHHPYYHGHHGWAHARYGYAAHHGYRHNLR
jgi:hypothetical protein